MVEGGIIKADKTEFTECFRTIRKTPYIMRIAFSAGIGGLLFGYDTGSSLFLPIKTYFFYCFLCFCYWIKSLL